MTATESIRAAVGRNMQQEREIGMYGVTEAALRENIESTIEAQRQLLNRAKWVLFEYMDTTK